MVQTICEHPGAAFQLLVVMGAIIAGLTALLIRIISISYRRDDKARMQRIEELHVEAQAAWARIESKIDIMEGRYIDCQRHLPLQYLSKLEYKEFLDRREKQWSDFMAKFEDFTVRFWKHRHIQNGEVERM